MDPIGAYPIDPATPVGQFRLLSGDSQGTPANPPTTPQTATYQYWSDTEIESFIEAAGGGIPLAISLAYSQMAAHWSSTGATIRTDDLTYSAKDSVGSWLNLANYWRDIADREDEAAVNDYFDLVPVGRDCTIVPEASAWPSCTCIGRCRGGCGW